MCTDVFDLHLNNAFQFLSDLKKIFPIYVRQEKTKIWHLLEDWLKKTLKMMGMIINVFSNSGFALVLHYLLENFSTHQWEILPLYVYPVLEVFSCILTLQCFKQKEVFPNCSVLCDYISFEYIYAKYSYPTENHVEYIF